MLSYKQTIVLIFLMLFIGSPFFTKAQGVRPESDKPFVVIIDPGHGGFDPGARGRYSSEKEIALGVSLKAGKLISKIPDVKVLYTRTKDMVPGNKTNKRDGLHYRADFANENKGNVFISIHCNSARNHKAKGTEVYVWGLRKNASKDLALRENAPLKDDPEFQALQNSPNSAVDAIFWNSVRRNYMKQSLTLAADVENQFAKLDRIDRTVKQRKVGIWVLHATAMPSILIETGFISNPQEEDYLNNKQDEIAKSIFNAFVNYLSGIKGLTKDELLAGVRPNKDHRSAKDTGYHYRIQLLAGSKKLDTHSKKFQELGDWVQRKPIQKKEEGILYRYLLGDYATFQDATKKLKKVKRHGFKEAFIVIYKGNKRLEL